jgi:hypothetical protein
MDEEVEDVGPCLCGRGLLGSLFGFITGFTYLLLMSEIGFSGLLVISFFTSFGYLGSSLENPLDINLRSFGVIFLVCFVCYGLLFVVCGDLIGLFLAVLVVGNALPYIEVIFRIHSIISPQQNRCVDDLTILKV